MKDFITKKELINQANIKASLPKFKPVSNNKKGQANKKEPIKSIDE
jgi:hypothetical protein